LSDSLYFDNDCISAFLWTKTEWILESLFPNNILVPKEVYIELSKVPYLKGRIDNLINSGQATIHEIILGSEESNLFQSLTGLTEGRRIVIGKGEAAVLSLVKFRGGIVASNNLKDISDYIKEYCLRHTTTAEILVEAFENGLITEIDANNIWANMLAKKRKLGATTFSDYYKSKSH